MQGYRAKLPCQRLHSVSLSRPKAPIPPRTRTTLLPCNVATPRKGVSQKGEPMELVSREDAPLVFVDDNGQRIPVMAADYGFRSGGGRLYQDDYGQVPTGMFELAIDNFKKELRALRRSVRFDEINSKTAKSGPLRQLGSAVGHATRSALMKADDWLVGNDFLKELDLPRDARDPKLTPKQSEVLAKVGQLTLSDPLVALRERRREEQEGRVNAPWYVRFTYDSLCWVLDLIYEGRPIQRFWFLETVARMPYFSYISMLHLYESLGWWRAGAELRKVHFAEEWNELHHLQIMESLGGDQRWVDRFMSQHAAIFYFWVCIGVYLLSPPASYAFSELVENHAADTYAEFVEQNAELLKTIPPPLVALNYYKAGDLYMFDSFMTGWEGVEPRRPACNNLYDVFVNIRDDELEHIKTMKACKDGALDLDLDETNRLRRLVAEEQVRTVLSQDCVGDECPADWD